MILLKKMREKACLWDRLTRMKIATETLLFVGPKIRFVDVESLEKFSLRTTHILFIATCALQQVDHILRVAVIRLRKNPEKPRIICIIKHGSLLHNRAYLAPSAIALKRTFFYQLLI